MTQINQAYIGIGKVHARLAGTTNKLRHVGNVSQLLAKQTLDVKKQKDYTRPGGGTLKKVERIESVDADMTWLSLNSENLALAVAGDITAVASATITAETVKGYKDSLLLLAHPPLSITSVTNAGATTTYDAGDDYELSAAGIYIPAGSDITEAQDLKITYEHHAYDRIEAATKTASVLELVFEGLNEAESNTPMVVVFHRMSVPAAAELSLIGDEMGDLKFSAEVLKDTTKGAGLSAYFVAKKVTPA